jgi:hypothetical protein
LILAFYPPDRLNQAECQHLLVSRAGFLLFTFYFSLPTACLADLIDETESIC